MLLAEALIEKDYISKSIDNLYSVISDLSIVSDKNTVKLNKDLLEFKFEELEDLYTKYQQFSIMISRAESITIVINETEVSLRDARVIRDVMSGKLNRLINFSSETFKKKSDNLICVDRNELEKMIEMLRSDIKTLDIKIQNKLWSTKVK